MDAEKNSAYQYGPIISVLFDVQFSFAYHWKSLNDWIFMVLIHFFLCQKNKVVIYTHQCVEKVYIYHLFFHEILKNNYLRFSSFSVVLQKI